MIRTRITSSMAKVFPDSHIDDFAPLTTISALRGERVSIQLLHEYEADDKPLPWGGARVPLTTAGELFRYATMRRVAYVPVNKTLLQHQTDDNYERTAPGMFPDVLQPLYYGGKVTLTSDMIGATWIDFELPQDLAAGDYTLTMYVEDTNPGGYGKSEESTLCVTVIDAVLPKIDFRFTQWFHADCLANYYNVEVWSDEHFRIVENFVHTAVHGGINMLLTPVFTPPLDTAVGGERRTTQLVGVRLDKDTYTFDFSLLDRWIDMCDRQGIEYLEISHFFTQWGAAHAPKIMATVDGTYQQIFGWQTDATGDEYVRFLRTFLTALLAHLKARGDDRRCIFHVSDEPGLAHLEQYRAARAVISDLLEGYTIMDELSKFEFYETGAVDHPIPSNNHIAPFLEAGIPDLWTYYCVSQALLVSNRYHSMPACRNRSIGMQLFKYNIKGFLHWGYNFYNNQNSGDPINPYVEQSADFAFPGGDAFSVYPAMDGTALESMRFVVFHEALQDMRAMKLAEGLTDHDTVVAAIEEVFGRTLTFDTCAKSADMILRIRERVNRIISDHLVK